MNLWANELPVVFLCWGSSIHILMWGIPPGSRAAIYILMMGLPHSGDNSVVGFFPLGGQLHCWVYFHSKVPDHHSNLFGALPRSRHIQSVVGWHPHFRPLFAGLLRPRLLVTYGIYMRVFLFGLSPWRTSPEWLWIGRSLEEENFT